MGQKREKKNPLTKVYAGALAIVVAAIVAVIVYQYLTKTYDKETKWLYIPENSTEQSVVDSLKQLDTDFGGRVATLWKSMGGAPLTAHGAYRLEKGTSAASFARRIKNGRQTPVNLTFNNQRTVGSLAEKIASRMEFTSNEFIEACDSVLPPNGFSVEQYPAAFLPDTYQFYWTSSPKKVVETLLEYRNKFWTDERRQQAKKLGLTPVGVATIASIVEEETAKTDERPTVARLYLNRLAKGMKLQADPTVKFAAGDFSLRRIGGNILKINSPYNTYLYEGLPPGPIRIAEEKTLQQVLDAPPHSYIYMCAKDDFSGYHSFATDFQTHLENAKKYQRALDKKGISLHGN